MRYDVTADVIGFTGEPIKTSNTDPTPVKLRTLLQAALSNADPAEFKTGDQKIALYVILEKVHNDDILDVTAEDVALLKKVVGRLFGVPTVGAVYKVLENPLPQDTANGDSPRSTE